jgi:hypothetical protein
VRDKSVVGISLLCILESFLLTIIGEHKNVPYFVLQVSVPPEAINYLSLELSLAIQFVDFSSSMDAR